MKSRGLSQRQYQPSQPKGLMSKTRPQEKSKDGGLECSALAGAILDSVTCQGNRAPRSTKTKAPSHSLEQPPASLCKLLLGATGMGRKTPSLDPPSLHNPNHPKSGPLYLNTNSRSAAHPQPLYEGAGGGQQHASDTYPWKATTFYRLKN